MKKFKVRYYNGNDSINEKEIEAKRFITKENVNGVSVAFYDDTGSNSSTFAFSNFISIEKID